MRLNARIEFLGSKAQKIARAMYDALLNSRMYEGVDINADYDDTVSFRFKKAGGLALLAQHQFLAINLSEVGSAHSSYAFVGPKCPGIGRGVDHAADRRNMHHFPDSHQGEVWRCREPKCRYTQPLCVDDFMSIGDFRMNFSLLIAEKVSTLPSNMKNADFKQLFDQQRETVTGRTTYPEMPTREEKQKVCKTLMGVDYADIEQKIVMRYLGLTDPSFKYTKDFATSATGSAFLDGKPGNVLLIPSDSEMVGRRMISNWISSHKHDNRYLLAVTRVERKDFMASLDTETYKGTTKPGTLPSFEEGLEEVRFSRKTTFRKSDWSMSLEAMKEKAEITEEQARLLVAKLLTDFPAINQYFQGQQNAMLQADNDQLREELGDMEGSRDFLQDKLNKKSEEKPAPKDVVSSADAMLRFLAGINFQDQSIKDQREFISRFSELKKSLEAEKAKG